MQLIITASGQEFIPENLKKFFPNGVVDGHLYLKIKDENKMEIWQCIYADNYPWKIREDHHVFVEEVSTKVGKTIAKKVEEWNELRKKLEEEKEAKKKEREAAFKQWCDALPRQIGGLIREGDQLLDRFGNTLFWLSGLHMAFKTEEEIEQEIEQFFADGGEE